jgi:hypothetical protein
MSKVFMSVALCAGMLGTFAAPAAAQSDPKVAYTGAIDFSNRYMFRGLRQNIDEMAIFPFLDAAIPAFSGDGALKTVTINVGTWNAFHTEINKDEFTNRDGDPTGNKWYESDLYGTVGFGFSAGTLGFTYTSYMSPANLWHNIQELAIKFTYDDSGSLGKASMKPYALIAFELGDGQADAGEDKGTYVELGVAPGYAGSKASIAFPIKVGLSANNYYEFGTGSDDGFGYFSLAGVVTVPLGPHLNIHGSVEMQTFGDNVKFYNSFGDNEDDPSSVTGIYTIGLGFSF